MTASSGAVPFDDQSFTLNINWGFFGRGPWGPALAGLATQDLGMLPAPSLLGCCFGHRDTKLRPLKR
jgi:hypothetical protein